MKPSDYFRRQLYATFIDDPFGVKTYEDIGVGNFLWSTDYPHSSSTWPNSQDAMTRMFAAVPEPDLRKLARENATQLYGLNPA
jgi:predicted TIM-barrel fold metal-dependent hydrolase